MESCVGPFAFGDSECRGIIPCRHSGSWIPIGSNTIGLLGKKGCVRFILKRVRDWHVTGSVGVNRSMNAVEL